MSFGCKRKKKVLLFFGSLKCQTSTKQRITALQTAFGLRLSWLRPHTEARENLKKKWTKEKQHKKIASGEREQTSHEKNMKEQSTKPERK